MFNPLDFTNLNETDVREEIIAPLIRFLGYRSGTENNVIREQSLRYPKIFLGKKQPQKDPILRGKADYILEAHNSVRWVIEAKAPTVNIDLDVVEQAYTYASHPEVRAVYFVLCNGHDLIVYQTAHGPGCPPIFEAIYQQLNEKLANISNLLSPSAIIRDNPNIKPDTGIPIGPGLRSVVRIANGFIHYKNNSLDNIFLNELQSTISEGAIERDEKGRLVAYLKTHGPMRSFQELNERIGLASFEMESFDSELSTEKENPTTFVYENTIILPAGESFLDINTWQQVTIPMNISCHVFAEAKGILGGNRFSGTFTTIMRYIEANVNIQTQGMFEVFLA